MMADELLNAQDLITAKKHDTFHSEVITGKAGGLSTGANIDYATNAVTGQVQKTLPATIDGLDWSYVGKFADGVTFTKKTDFAIDANGTQWIYTGSLPFMATAGTVPSEPNYQVVHVKSASAISNANGGSVQDFIDNLSQSSFETVNDAIEADLQIGLAVTTRFYNCAVQQSWEVVSSGMVPIYAGYPAEDGTLQMTNGNYLKMVGDVDHRWFGAYGDVDESTKAGTSDTTAIRAYAEYVKLNKVPMIFGEGKVFFGELDNNEINLEGLDFDFVLKGKGLFTRFIRGNLAVTSKFARLFFIRNAAGASVNVSISDVYVDDNSSGNPITNGDPFQYQSAHVFAVLPVGYRGFNNVIYENIFGVDIIADLCGCGGNALDTVRSYNASNIIVPRRNRQRFDVGITCSYDYFTATNCDVVRIEAETNSTDSRDIGFTKLVNVSSDSIDMLYKPTVGTVAPTLQTTNCTSRKLVYVDGFNWIDVKSNLLLQEPMRFVGNGESVPCRFVLDGTSFKKSDTYVNPLSKPFIWIESSATSPTEIKFINDYTIDSVDQVAFGDLNATLASKSVYFGKGTVKSTNATPISLRSGIFTFDGVKFYGNGDGTNPMIYQENLTSTINSNTLTVHNCTVSTNNPLVRMASGTATRAISMKGNKPFAIDKIYSNLRADKLKAPWGTGTEISVLNLDTFNVTGGIPATGNFIKGNKFRYLDPSDGGFIGAVCVTTGVASAANIKQFGLIA